MVVWFKCSDPQLPEPIDSLIHLAHWVLKVETSWTDIPVTNKPTRRPARVGCQIAEAAGHLHIQSTCVCHILDYSLYRIYTYIEEQGGRITHTGFDVFEATNTITISTHSLVQQPSCQTTWNMSTMKSSKAWKPFGPFGLWMHFERSDPQNKNAFEHQTTNELPPRRTKDHSFPSECLLGSRGRHGSRTP